MKKHRTAPARNIHSQSLVRHRKEVLWQITIPLVIGVVVLLVIAILSVSMGQGDTRRWADISLIWLIIPVMFLGFISLIMLVGSVLALLKLIQVLPIYSDRLQRGFLQASALLRKVGERSVEPTLRLSAFSASAKRLFRLLVGGRPQAWRETRSRMVESQIVSRD